MRTNIPLDRVPFCRCPTALQQPAGRWSAMSSAGSAPPFVPFRCCNVQRELRPKKEPPNCWSFGKKVAVAATEVNASICHLD